MTDNRKLAYAQDIESLEEEGAKEVCAQYCVKCRKVSHMEKVLPQRFIEDGKVKTIMLRIMLIVEIADILMDKIWSPANRDNSMLHLKAGSSSNYTLPPALVIETTHTLPAALPPAPLLPSPLPPAKDHHKYRLPTNKDRYIYRKTCG